MPKKHLKITKADFIMAFILLAAVIYHLLYGFFKTELEKHTVWLSLALMWSIYFYMRYNIRKK